MQNSDRFNTICPVHQETDSSHSSWNLNYWACKWIKTNLRFIVPDLKLKLKSNCSLFIILFHNLPNSLEYCEIVIQIDVFFLILNDRYKTSHHLDLKIKMVTSEITNNYLSLLRLLSKTRPRTLSSRAFCGLLVKNW